MLLAVRRTNGRNAMQRRAAAANFAVAAAVAAEAADALPNSTHYSSRASGKSHAAHKRHGSNAMTKTSLDHVRSGRITKTVSSGSSGAGSSGGIVRFANLIEALGEFEARQGGFGQPSKALTHVSGKHSGPVLFDGSSNVSRWHGPIGPSSPKVLALGDDRFHLASSSSQSVVTWSPSLTNSMSDGGSSLPQQIPLFKSAG